MKCCLLQKIDADSVEKTRENAEKPKQALEGEGYEPGPSVLSHSSLSVFLQRLLDPFSQLPEVWRAYYPL